MSHPAIPPAQHQASARGTDARCPPLYGTVHATVQPPSRDPRIKFVTFGGDEDLRQSAVNAALAKQPTIDRLLSLASRATAHRHFGWAARLEARAWAVRSDARHELWMANLSLKARERMGLLTEPTSRAVKVNEVVL